jgi:hypothetical protein
MSNTQPFQAILKASQSEAIDAIIAGLAVEQNGFFLTDEQMTNIDAALVASEAATAKVEEITGQLATANQSVEAAYTSLTAANEEIVALKAEIEQMKKADATTGSDAGIGADRSDSAPKKYETSVDREMAERKAKYGF